MTISAPQVTTANTGLKDEKALLKWIKEQPDLQDKPEAILAAIDDFGKTHRIINLGPNKGKILVNQLKETEPEVVVELGTHTGYSSILIANELNKIGSSTSKVYTFEVDETLFNLSQEIIKLSGLGHRIVQIFGKASDKLESLYTDYRIDRIHFLFIDHWKYFYLPDLRAVETLGYITTGSTIFADNVIRPGAPDYVQYVKSPPIYKNEFNTKTTNINGKHFVGKWGLLYDSETVESTTGRGEKDGVEVTKCVGILDS